MTTTKTDTISLPRIDETAPVDSTRANDLQKELFATRILNHWGTAKSNGTEEAFFTDILGVDTKEAYLEFRARMKAWLRIMARGQKALKAYMAENGDCIEQWYKVRGAGAVTGLIEIRIAGKAFSAARAEAARRDTAA